MTDHARTTWMLQTKRADFDALSREFLISPVTARIIRNRDVVGEEAVRRYLYGTLEDLHDPHSLKDMDLAVRILRRAILEKKRIRVVGDYDIDGVCSTYLLLKGLRRCGARVDYQIPERIRDGYGINEAIIERAAADGIDLILTCDNGIAALEQIALAKKLGMTVIITDHHEVPCDEMGAEMLPPADAIVNPKQAACTYPFAGICGAMIAYKLVQVLYEDFGVAKEEWEAMLEFAAIATVGDVMKLQDENRIVVRYGLRRMPQTESIGLRRLVEACGLDIHALTAYHIGFVIGPCLNASGRLQTAKLAVELLLCEDEELAGELAAQLQQLNEERKDMTKQGVDEALAQAEACYANDSVLVLFLPDCHESLAGIIAGRVREAWNRPVFVLTRSEEGAKGSGRSIEAYHMYQGLCGVRDLLLKFGGHPMAAGFSLREEDIGEFRRRLNEQARLKPEDFIPKIWVDVALPLEYISEALVQEIRQLEPFGNGNEKPQFAQKGLYIRSARVFGKRRNVVKLSLVSPKGTAMDGLLFADGDRFLEELGNQKTIDIVYYPDVDEYNGRRSLQLVIREYKLRPEKTI